MGIRGLPRAVAAAAPCSSAIIGAVPVMIRPGIPADARAAADLWLRARHAALRVIPAPVHSDDDVRAWFASHVLPECELWVAEDEAGSLAGIMVLSGPWLDQLYIEPTMTGRGIGAELLRLPNAERPHGPRLGAV